MRAMAKAQLQEGKKAYREFESLAKRLMAVPKSEVDALAKRRQRTQKRKSKKAPAGN
jgi:hypothetical protein